MSIHSLIEKGVDVFSYIPDVDSFQGNYKKLKYAWNGENNKFPTLSKDHVVADHLNYAIRPSFKFVDLDFDCELAVNWGNQAFNGCHKFGRNGKGHALVEITNPQSFSRKQIKFGQGVLIEMRGEGNYSVLQGKLSDPIGEASFSIADNPEYDFNTVVEQFYTIGLVCQLVEGYSGSVNDYLIPIVGEMIFQKLDTDTIHYLILNFLLAIGRSERLGETRKSVDAMIKKNNPSKLERLNWSTQDMFEVRGSIIQLAKGVPEEEIVKPVSNTMDWISLGTIIKKDYEPIEEIVEGMLTSGLFFLASKPKLGKSFLTMHLCHSIATGTPFLGRPVIQGTVLFVALEDNERRINSRAKLMDLDECDNFLLSFTSPKLMEGLEEALVKKIHAVRADPNMLDVKLIILDTFIRAKSSKKVGGNDAYEEGSFLIDKFQRDMLAENVCAMANTHDKKGDERKGEDTINRMIGTSAYQGQDGNWRLDRARGTGIEDPETTMTIVARDLPEQEYQIKLNNGTWTMVGVAEQGEKHDKLTRNILACVEAISESIADDSREVQGDCKTVELIAEMRRSNFIEWDEANHKQKFDRGDWNVKAKVKSMRKRGLLIQGERYGSFKIPKVVDDIPYDDEDLPF